MAALCPNISYGLSQSFNNDNKEVIFVKLTDSAYRAIEDYQKNQVRFGFFPFENFFSLKIIESVILVICL